MRGACRMGHLDLEETDGSCPSAARTSNTSDEMYAMGYGGMRS